MIQGKQGKNSRCVPPEEPCESFGVIAVLMLRTLGVCDKEETRMDEIVVGEMGEGKDGGGRREERGRGGGEKENKKGTRRKKRKARPSPEGRCDS
jgi:hypothetical protein